MAHIAQSKQFCDELSTTTLYPLVKRIDSTHAKEVKRRLPERKSDIFLSGFNVLLGAFIALAIALAIAKQSFYPNDTAFWQPIGLGLLLTLMTIAVGWVSWFLIDTITLALSMYRNHLRDIDVGLSRDEIVASRLRTEIHSLLQTGAEVQRPLPPLPDTAKKRIHALIRHLESNSKVRATRANFGALLGALAGVLITTADATQKFLTVQLPAQALIYINALAIGALLASLLQIRFAAKLTRLAELLERVLTLEANTT